MRDQIIREQGIRRPGRLSFILKFAIVAGLFSVSPLGAETLRFSNIDQTGAYHGAEDTSIHSNEPEVSRGGSPRLAVGASEKTLLRFSGLPLPASTRIKQASITLFLEKIEGDWKGAEVVVYAVAPAAAGWSAGQADGKAENGATSWDHLLYSEIKNIQTGLPMHTPMAGKKGFSEPGKDYLPEPLSRIKLESNDANLRISLPLSDPELVKSWQENKVLNGGFLLVVEGLPPNSSARAWFSSSESGQANQRPALVLETEKENVSSPVVNGGAVAGGIRYSLKEAGLVSLAIYNGQGQVVRELLHAAERTAGPHEEAWNGLDEAGQKVPPGSYSWKLLRTQGLQAEYLMTLGLSVDFFNLWPGNHVGVTGLAVDATGVYFGSGCSEARGFVMKATADGTRLWSVNQNWFEAWQGPHSLAVDGNNLFLMQENYNIVKLPADRGGSGPIWDLVYDKTKPKDRPASTREDGGWVKMKLGQAGETAAVDLAAGQGKLVMSYELFNCIRWISQENGKVLKEIKVREPLGVAIDPQGRALVISEGQILSFNEGSDSGIPLIRANQLDSPWRVSVNPANGEIWVAERGTSQQVKRFSADGKLLKTFGAKGGRPAQGLYDGQAGFRNVNSLAPAPDGSFWITEAFSAPRRLAHFDRDGKLIREWYGPQMYANRASADPSDPTLVWMDSMWGELIQARVDYAQKTWKVLATYSYMNPLQPRYRHENGMWFVGHANGKTYLAKETEPNVLMVDEPGRRLVPMFKVGNAFYPGGNAGWQIPPELRPPESPWPGQTSAEPKPPAPWDFIWSNQTGGTRISLSEMTFGRELFAFPHHGFVRPDLTYVTALNISWKEGNSPWIRKGGPSIFKPSGYSAVGVPEYHLEEAGNLPLKMPDYLGPIRALWENAEGDIFTAHNATKSRSGQGPFGVGKTASGLAGNYVAKWNAAGDLRWAVGRHSATANTGPGEVRNFYRMAGSANGCIAVNDIDYGMVHVWDQDGLWVGRLMDHGLVTPSIPKDAYELCGENFGGYLFKNSRDGQVYFLGGSYNATPVYRITGWDKFERQQGGLELK